MPVPASAISSQPIARSALVTEVTGTPVPGGAASHLRLRDATPTVKTISGYSYMGCYTDAASPRILGSESADWSSINDPSMCCQWCANMNTDYSYCGVEDKTQCFCDSEENNTATNALASESECSAECFGNSGIKCGAEGRINIYSATVDIGAAVTVDGPPTTATVSGYTHMGCARDSTARLLRQTSFAESVYMDPAYCCSLCLNYDNGNVLCGVEFGNQCFCDGQNATSNIIFTSSTYCSDSCVGHGDQLCGGTFFMNLYSATGVLPSQSLASTASTTDDSSIRSSSTGTGSPTPKPSPGPSGLHGGAIAGVVVGSLAGVALIAGLAYFLWRCRRRPSNLSDQPSIPPPVEVPGDIKHGGPGPYQLEAIPSPPAQNTQYYELQADQASPHQ
ncbi:hypothetical protein Sste5346_003549 [Sporothrix stenoceras]|uniref:WSC domain-containing protein n=1 Tax=Sporothrix stenoceras TaxID=5173 RepID=A0ABR3ZCV1_9PEZI